MNPAHAPRDICKHRIQGKSPRLFLLFLLSLILTSPSLLHAQAKTENIRVFVAPQGEVRVGQKITLNFDLMTTTWFSGSPEFDLPEISGAIITKVGSFGVNRTETIDGIKYSVQGHEFALFVQRPDEIVIQPFSVRFFPADPGAVKPRDVTRTTPELRIKATLPPGAENLTSLISTNQFELLEKWSPPPEAAKVGDAFTRNITMRAEDVLGMAFPPLEIPEIKGVGVYSKEPSVRDITDRGSFTGERTETITYVCEEAGTAILPEVVVPWWNLDREELKTDTLPAVTLKVKPNPQLTQEAGSTSPLSATKRAVKGVSLMVAVLAACLGAFYRFRTTLRLNIRAWKAARHESEKTYFNHFVTACRSGNQKDTYKSLLSWLDKIHTGGHPATLHWLVTVSDNPALFKQAAMLKSELFQKNKQASDAWNSQIFFHEVARTRRELLKKRAIRHDKQSLPDLNPS